MQSQADHLSVTEGPLASERQCYKIKEYYAWGTIYKVVFQSWYTHSHIQQHIWAYVHTHKEVRINFQYGNAESLIMEINIEVIIFPAVLTFSKS